MISCRACIESLRPDDPRIRSGRYGLCGCDYCNKPTYYRELEADPPVKEVARPQMNLQPIKGELNYLLNKINSHIDASKKQVDKENYAPF